MRKGILILLFFVVLLGGGIALGASLEGRTKENVLANRTLEHSSEQRQQERPSGTLPVKLAVEDISYEVVLQPGAVAYDLMVKAQETTDFSFSGTKFPGMGFFVESINGIAQNPRTGMYWIYYINGLKAEVGISAYQLKEHDVISWKYEQEE